jgi:hypothetical protein
MLVLAPISMAALFRNSAAPSNIGLLSRMVPTWPALVIGGRGASGKIDRQPYASHRNGPQASKCGARTRSGVPCKSAPVAGRRRCRMHGGADGSGAPPGPKNGNYKHGRYTEDVAATRRWLREATHMLRELNKRP